MKRTPDTSTRFRCALPRVQKRMVKRRKQKPPYSGQLFVQMPDKSEKKLKLPRADDFQVGDKELIEFEYKGLKVRVPLVRVAGGWEVVGAR